MVKDGMRVVADEGRVEFVVESQEDNDIDEVVEREITEGGKRMPGRLERRVMLMRCC